MKKRLLAMLLAVAMVLTYTPVVAMATETEQGEAVAQIGDTTYTSLADAVDAGGEIKLLQDVTLDDVILIAKDVTINGNNHKVTSSANRVFRVTQSNLNVVMNNLNINSTATRTGTEEIRGISMDTNIQNVQLTLNNCSVDMIVPDGCDWAYAVNVCSGSSGHTITINGGTYESANVINVWGDNHIVTIDGATLNCMYTYNAMYYGSCVCLEGSGVNLTVKNTTFSGDHAIALEERQSGKNSITMESNTDNTSLAYDAEIDGEVYGAVADAVAAAEDGDIIILRRNVEISSQLVIDKAITLVGNGKKITALSGAEGKYGEYSDYMITVSAGATVKNLVIDGGEANVMGIQFYACNGVLENVTIQNISRYYPVHVNAAEVQIAGKLVVNNDVADYVPLVAVGYGKNIAEGTNSSLTMADGASITGAAVYFVAEDLENAAESKGTMSATVNEGTTVAGAVAKVGNVYYATLKEAVAKTASGGVITLMEGEHTLPEFTNKELTFVGQNRVKTYINDYVAKGSQGMAGSTVHFENLTVNGHSENYYGLYHTTKLTYKDCDINGLRFLYAPEVSFEDCAFNATGEHSFWTYGASNITVTGCAFTYTDRAVNCYLEDPKDNSAVVNISFDGCSFTYNGEKETPEGAVEINSCFTKEMNVTMNNCTAPAKGAMWYISQWDNAKGEHTTVEDNGVTVWPVYAAQVGDVKYATLQAAIDAAMASEMDDSGWYPEVTLLTSVNEIITIRETENYGSLNVYLGGNTISGAPTKEAEGVLNVLGLVELNLYTGAIKNTGTMGAGIYMTKGGVTLYGGLAVTGAKVGIHNIGRQVALLEKSAVTVSAENGVGVRLESNTDGAVGSISVFGATITGGMSEGGAGIESDVDTEIHVTREALNSPDNKIEGYNGVYLRGLIDLGTPFVPGGTITGKNAAIVVAGATECAMESTYNIMVNNGILGTKDVTEYAIYVGDVSCAAKIRVDGGTINGKISETGTVKSNFGLYAGSYSVDPSEFLANNQIAKKNADGYYVVEDIQPVAEVYDAEGNWMDSYYTLAEAIADAKSGYVVKLVEDVVLTERVAITKDVTITAEEAHTITVTIAKGNTGAAFGGLYVTNGTLTLGNNVTVTNVNSEESGVSTVTTKGENAKVIVDGATVKSECKNNAIEAANGSVVTINNGHVYSTQLAAAYASGGATITVNGGKVGHEEYNVYGLIASKTAATIGGKIVINGGWVCHVLAHEAATSEVTIYGGEVVGSVGAKDGATMTITGGIFTRDPAAYVAEEYAATYAGGKYTVSMKTENAPEVDTNVSVGNGDASVDASVTDEHVTANINNVVTNGTTQTDLKEAAYNLQNDATVVGTPEAAKTKLEEKKVTVDDDTTVTVEVQPYLDVAVQKTETTTEGETTVKSMTVDISAYYDVVAVATKDGAEIGSATLKEKEPLTTSEPIYISVPLPADFARKGDTIYVHHYKDGTLVATHEATVSADEADTLYASFVNDKGFSTFVFSTSSTVPELDTDEPEVELARFEATSMVLEEAIDIRFWIPKADLGDVDGAYAVITLTTAKGEVRSSGNIPSADWDGTSDTYYKIRFNNVAAKEMCDTITVNVYNEAGKPIAETLEYTLGKAIVAMYKSNSNDQDIKELAVAMLNYGAAAQKAFDYNEENLATQYLNDLNG